MEDAVGYMRGKKPRVAVHKVEIPSDVDVRAIREKLHLSRQDLQIALVLVPGHCSTGSRVIDTRMGLLEFFCCYFIVILLSLKIFSVERRRQEVMVYGF